MSALTDKIEQSIKGITDELGFDIVRVAILSGARRKVLQIMIENKDGSPIVIEDCEKVSRLVSDQLYVDDPIKGEYNLEVSSSGIDRPLVKPSDFEKFCKSPVVVKTYVSKNNQKSFKGVLESATENGILLRLDVPLSTGDSDIEIMYEEISNAHIDGFKLLK